MSKKKLSIPKKSIFMAIALIGILVLPIAYTLIQKNLKEEKNWNSSSWIYRRSIYVSNPDSTLIDEEILIEYDTATLISEEKLQEDCDDLRFVDSNDSTALEYWIEGGCNSPTTHIWVRIPNLPKEGKTIYLYYGNSTALNSQEPWSGKFYLMTDTQCSHDWENESESTSSFFQKFPLGGSQFGETGGDSKHIHQSVSLKTNESLDSTKTNSEGEENTSTNHSHTISVSTKTPDSDILPPYLDMIFCSNEHLIINQNSIGIFDTIVPNDFSRFVQLDNKFPRGNSIYGKSSSDLIHTHILKEEVTSIPDTPSLCQVGDIPVSSSNHTHKVISSKVENSQILPEYLSVIYGKSNRDVMAPFGTIVMSNALPPLGWTNFSELENKFPYGSSSYGNKGGFTSHSHNIELTLNNSSEAVDCLEGNFSTSSFQHTHSLSGQLSEESNNPPYVKTLFIKKKTSLPVTINNEEIKNVIPNKPSLLQVDGKENPNDISNQNPLFTAIFSDPNSNDTGQYYQIEVNTNVNFSGSVIWDSGKINMTSVNNGERIPEIVYSGLKLYSTTYYWRIRLWDNQDSVSQWSNTAQFTFKSPVVATKDIKSESIPEVLGVSAQNYYAESTTESTWNANTSYQDKTTLTFTPDSNSTYLIIASWLMRETTLGTGYYVQGKLTRTTGTAKDFNELIYYPKDATDYVSGGTIGIDTFGESPTSQTYKIQYGTTNTLSVARIKEAKMIALKLDDTLDEYAEEETRTTTTSATYQDKTTLSITPATTGDYIILASATLDGSSASYDYRAQLTIDGTAYSTTNIETNLATNRELWFVLKKVNLSAASHTIKIQYSSESSAGTTGIADARIVAIRADRFLNNYYAENETRATTTSTSYQTYLTLTDTPQATDHLILAVEDLDASSTSYSTYGQALKGATTYGEMLREAKDATGRGMQYFTLKKETLTNSSTSWYLQYRSENAAATAGINNGRILVLELTEPSINVSSYGTQVSTVSPSTSNFFVGGAFTFIRDASTDTVTSITVSETGTISDSNISGLILYYKQEATCSSSIPGDATQFNSTPGTFSSGSSTVTGSMSVGTSQICLYAEMDVGSASIGNSIELQITNPSTQITASRAVTPATAVAISGTTTVSSINTNPNTPSSLLTESSTNPTKVTDTTPEFSAIFTDINPSDTGTYYQIEVNTQSDFLGTTIWDSTKTSTGPITNGSRSSNISYAGTTLTINGTTYYWRMKFWDNNGGESNWSSTSSFIMSGPPVAPSSLKVDGINNPTQILSITPGFTSLHTDPNGDNAVYYEIEVNTLSNFTGTVRWDTGKVAMTSTPSGQYSPEITYAGTALTGDSSIVYYWRIRLWDTDDYVSDWSTTSSFTDFVSDEQYIQMEGVLLERVKIN